MAAHLTGSDRAFLARASMPIRPEDSSRPRCRRCRKFLTDPTAVARRHGPDCWQSLDPAERAEILSRLPRQLRPLRLRIRHVLPVGRRREEPGDAQPSLFDPPESGAA